MSSRQLLSLLTLTALTVLVQPTHAQNSGNGRAPAGRNSKVGQPTTTLVGTIPDPRFRKSAGPWILSRPEGDVRLDFSRFQVKHQVVALDPARVKFKGAKADEVVLTAAGVLSGQVMAVRELTLHLNPEQMKQHEAALANSCRSNLRQLEAAKEQWALDGKKPVGSVPTLAELLKDKVYLSRPPQCPMGGVYTLAAMGADPTCSLKGHTIR